MQWKGYLSISATFENCCFVLEPYDETANNVIYWKRVTSINTNKLTLDNCDLNNITLEVQSAKECIIRNKSRILNLKTGEHVIKLTIDNSEILNDLQLIPNVRSVIIENRSKIKRLPLGRIMGKTNTLQYFNISENSSITENERETYKRLRVILKSKPELYDRITDHLLYKKELAAYSKGVPKSEDWLLFWLHKIINRNGTSFLQPMAIAIILNTIFIILLTELSSSNILSLKDWSQVWQFLIQTFNLSPLTEYSSDMEESARNLDNFRRFILAIMIPFIVWPALRFRYKE